MLCSRRPDGETGVDEKQACLEERDDEETVAPLLFFAPVPSALKSHFVLDRDFNSLYVYVMES